MTTAFAADWVAYLPDFWIFGYLRVKPMKYHRIKYPLTFRIFKRFGIN